MYAGGDQVTVDAPLGHIPLFIRDGSIVPKGPVLQFVEQDVLRRVNVDLYPGPDTTFVMYEDDGKTFDFRNGALLRTELTRRDLAGGTTCTIRRIDGSWTPPADRSWWLDFHRIGAAPSSVDINGSATAAVASEQALETVAQGWFYRSDSVLIVRIADSSAPTTVTVRF